MRAVLDCNVVISALLAPGGAPAAVLKGLLRGEFEIVLSSAILDEWKRALGYPKIRRKLRLTPREEEALFVELSLLAVWVEARPLPGVAVEADPDDDIYLAAAVEGAADCVVSGDRHLLEIGDYAGLRIVSPREFLGLLSSAA